MQDVMASGRQEAEELAAAERRTLEVCDLPFEIAAH